MNNYSGCRQCLRIDEFALRYPAIPAIQLNRIMNREQELEDMDLNVGRHALPFHEIEYASDEDSDDMEDSDPGIDRLFDTYHIIYKRRAAHTMPGYGVDEYVSQPILWLALEKLRKHENYHIYRKRQTGAAGVAKKTFASPADFVAHYLIKNMTLDIFNNHNQPRYGPRQTPRRRN